MVTGTDLRITGEKKKASKLGFRVSDNANLLNRDLSSLAKKDLPQTDDGKHSWGVESCRTFMHFNKILPCERVPKCSQE